MRYNIRCNANVERMRIISIGLTLRNQLNQLNE